MSSKGWGAGFEIAGRYRLVEMLGKGGMGEVWRAEHLTLNAPVAIKLIEPNVASSQAALKRFMREARAAAALQSPHVVHTSDFGIHDNVPYIAMELLQGESLAQRLRRVGITSPAETAHIVNHVARGIQKAHDAGIVHRDLKPDNVFIVRDEDEEIVKVLDFGVAKAVGGTFGEDGAGTRTGALLGTPYYMSPEQAQGDRQVDHRSDLWSLGVIVYQCLTARLPFESEGLGSLVLKICTGPIPRPSEVAQVPAGFDEWFARALDRDPERRFQSAKEMSSALRAVLTGEENTAQRNWLSTDKSSPYAAANQSGPHVPQAGGSGADFSGRYTPYAGSTDLNLTTGHAAATELGVTAPAPAGRGWLLAVGGVLALGALISIGALVLFLKSRNDSTEVAETSPAASAPVPLVTETAKSADPPPTPVEPPTETTQEKPAPVAQKPAERPIDKTAKPVEKNVEKPAEKPAEKSATPAPTVKPSATASSKGRLGF